MTDNTQQFPMPSSPVVDPKSGKLTPIWVRFFLDIWKRTGGNNGGDTNDVFTFSALGAGDSDVVDIQENNDQLALLALMMSDSESSNGLNGGAIETVVVSGSPVSYTASKYGNIWIDPGTYAAVDIDRGGSTLSFGKVTRGIFPLSTGDTITVTYDTLTPTIYFIPA